MWSNLGVGKTNQDAQFSMHCVEEQTIAIVYATHKDGMNKGLSGLTCKILSRTSYIVEMERGGFTQLIYNI